MAHLNPGNSNLVPSDSQHEHQASCPDRTGKAKSTASSKADTVEEDPYPVRPVAGLPEPEECWDGDDEPPWPPSLCAQLKEYPQPTTPIRFIPALKLSSPRADTDSEEDPDTLARRLSALGTGKGTTE